MRTASSERTLGEPTVTVWIDDRHPIFRMGVAAILVKEGFEVAGESAGLMPQPDLDGLDVLVFEADPHSLHLALKLCGDSSTRLVAMVHSANEQLVADAIEGGASAVLLRAELGPATLVGCLRTVVGGNTALPAFLLPKLMERAANGGNGSRGGLSSRELAVLELLAEGEDTRNIAAELAYSERTVKNIVHDVLMKMNCRNRVQAVAQATRQGLI